MIEMISAYDLAIFKVMLDHSKIRKMPFWMIQIAENEVFGPFLEFGASDCLDIAYFDGTKWYLRFGHRISPAGPFKNQKRRIFE